MTMPKGWKSPTTKEEDPEKQMNEEYEKEQKKRVEEIRRLKKGYESTTFMPSW
jgi:hypothetical protein